MPPAVRAAARWRPPPRIQTAETQPHGSPRAQLNAPVSRVGPPRSCRGGWPQSPRRELRPRRIDIQRLCWQGRQHPLESPLADHRDVPDQRQPRIGQHDIDLARREAGGHRDRRVPRQRNLAVGQWQRFEGHRDNKAARSRKTFPRLLSIADQRLAVAQLRQRVCEGFAHRHTDHRQAGSKRDAVRQRQPGPDAGKTPWPDGDCDQIEFCRAQLRLVQYPALTMTGRRAAWPRTVSWCRVASVC